MFNNPVRFICFILFTLFVLISATQAQTNKNVIVIGIDGLRGDVFMSTHTPNLDQFSNAGEYSYDADMGTKTNCASAWTSLTTGVWNKKHGVKDETFKKSMLADYPHFYSLFKETNIRTASIVNWPVITSHIDCCSQMMLNSKNDNAVNEKTIDLINNDKADLILLNYHDLDVIGHQDGFENSNNSYVNEIQAIDNRFRHLLAAIKAHARKHQEEWMVIITTDHGGDDHESDGLSKLQHVRYAPQIIAFVSKDGDVVIDIPDFRVNLNEASLVNIVPTILDYYNMEKPYYLDGISYLQPLEVIRK